MVADSRDRREGDGPCCFAGSPMPRWHQGRVKTAFGKGKTAPPLLLIFLSSTARLPEHQ